MFCNSPLERLPDTEAVIGKRQRLLADFIQTEALAICVLVITATRQETGSGNSAMVSISARGEALNVMPISASSSSKASVIRSVDAV